MTLLWSNINASFDAPTPEALGGPYVRDRDPSPNEHDIAAGTNVLLTIAVANPRTIDLTTVTIAFSINGGGFVNVYTASTFQAGYSGSAAHGSDAFEDFYDFVINPAADFADGAVVSVRVEGEDDASSAIAPPELYTFYVVLPVVVPPEPPVPTAGIYPTRDTLRGGRRVFAFSNSPLTDPDWDVDFSTIHVPSGWMGSVVGSGSVVPSLNGLLLSSGPTASSIARVVADGTPYEHFDAWLDLTMEAPASLSDLEVWRWEFRTGGAVVALRGRFDAALGGVVIDTLCDTGAGSVIPSGNVALVLGAVTGLRIVRNGARVWVFVNGVQLLSTDRWVTGAGTFRISAMNGPGDAAKGVSVRLHDLRVRSHATLDGKLLLEKADIGRRRIEGLVPPGDLSRVSGTVEGSGTVDLVVFGPSGTATAEDEFTYTLPAGVATGRELLGQLETSTDPAVRDE